MNTKHLRNNVNMSNNREMSRQFSPFGNDREKDYNKFVVACVMLGGYKVRK